MEKYFRILMMGTVLGLIGLYFSGCQDSRQDRLKVTSGKPIDKAGGSASKEKNRELMQACEAYRKSQSGAEKDSPKAQKLKEKVDRLSNDNLFVTENEKSFSKSRTDFCRNLEG